MHENVTNKTYIEPTRLIDVLNRSEAKYGAADERTIAIKARIARLYSSSIGRLT